MVSFFTRGMPRMHRSTSVVEFGSSLEIRPVVGVRKEGAKGYLPPKCDHGGFTHLDVDVIGLAGFDLRACRSHFTCRPPTSLAHPSGTVFLCPSLIVGPVAASCAAQLTNAAGDISQLYCSLRIVTSPPARFNLFVRNSLPKRRWHVTGRLRHGRPCAAYSLRPRTRWSMLASVACE